MFTDHVSVNFELEKETKMRKYRYVPVFPNVIVYVNTRSD